MLNAASRLLRAIYPQPSLFEWRGAGPYHKFSLSLEASTEQVRRAKAGPSEEREIGMMETRTEREWRVMGRKKRENFIVSSLPISPIAPFP